MTALERIREMEKKNENNQFIGDYLSNQRFLLKALRVWREIAIQENYRRVEIGDSYEETENYVDGKFEERMK